MNALYAEIDSLRSLNAALIANVEEKERIIDSLVDENVELLEACEAVARLSDGQGRQNLIEVAGGMARAILAK
jgi:hypothetical protein